MRDWVANHVVRMTKSPNGLKEKGCGLRRQWRKMEWVGRMRGSMQVYYQDEAAQWTE